MYDVQKQNALYCHETWRDFKVKCGNARDYYMEICLDECATCQRYQGCHVMSEEQFMDLLNIVMYHADGRKIDWKANHKIECYINVLVSTETNDVRAFVIMAPSV